MATAKLTSFPHEVHRAWSMLLLHWKQACVLLLLLFVPLLFLTPLVTERVALANFGVSPLATPASGTALVSAILALLVFVLFSEVVKIAIFITLDGTATTPVRVSLRKGLKRFFPFVATELLVVLVTVVSLLPALLFATWYSIATLHIDTQSMNMQTMNIIAALLALLLLTPVFFVSIYVAFASLAVAVRDKKAGFPALHYSMQLVRGRGMRVCKRLIAWAFLQTVITTAVSVNPIANWLVPLTLSLMSAAFTIVMYRELRGE